MKAALAALFSSKKFLTAIIGTATVIAARYGFDLDKETALAILGLVAVLVGAQGAADHGKEAAKLQAPAAESEKPLKLDGGL